MIMEIVAEGLDMGDVIVAALKSQMAWEKDFHLLAIGTKAKNGRK
jgi:hypothetical protein